MKFKTKNIEISDIKISKCFQQSPPKSEKIAQCYDFYRAHEFLDRAVIVDKGNLLLDGYVAYLVAKMLGIQRVRAVEVSGADTNKARYGTDYHPAEVALNPGTKTESVREPIKLYCEVYIK